VPALRQWLTRKQRETRRGRAELQLAALAEHWSARPANRYLPSLWEWLNIRLWTRPRTWTLPQKRMMNRATRAHAFRAVVVLVVLTLTGWLGWEAFGQMRASALVEKLVSAGIDDVPAVIAQLAPYRRWAVPLLRERAVLAAPASPERLHVALALAPEDPDEVNYLLTRLRTVTPDEVVVVRSVLAPRRAELIETLWGWFKGDTDGPERLRAAALLAEYDPASDHWLRVRAPLVERLVAENLLLLGSWREALHPARRALLPALADLIRRNSTPAEKRAVAASIVAEFAADQPALLADLSLEGEARSFLALWPALRRHPGAALERFRAELKRSLPDEWNDPPLNPTWTDVPSAVEAELDNANGHLRDRFALCQSLPLSRLADLDRGLNRCGYRLTRLRPYALPEAGAEIQVAALWQRDGRATRYQIGTSEAVLLRDAELRREGFGPIDVAGFPDPEGERYAVVWVRGDVDPETELAVGIESGTFESEARPGKVLTTLQVFRDRSARIRASALWVRGSEGSHALDLTASELGARLGTGLQRDLAVYPVPAPPPATLRFAARLERAEQAARAAPDSPPVLLERAVARYQRGQLEGARADLDRFIALTDQVALPEPYFYRALVAARLGRDEDARADLLSFRKRNSDDSARAYLDCAVTLLLGNRPDALAEMDRALRKHPREAPFLLAAARLHALAVRQETASSAARLVAGLPSLVPVSLAGISSARDRVVALLRQAEEAGFSDLVGLQIDPELSVLEGDADFEEFLARGRPDRRYAGVWGSAADRTSTVLTDLSPQAHWRRGSERMALGDRPVALSVTPLPLGQVVVSSIWHHPVVPDGIRDALASRQATAAAGLVLLADTDPVWGLFPHSTDPRLRSFLIHRLGELGVDPRVLMKRLETESSTSARRGLLLALGETTASGKFRPDRGLIDDLLDQYRLQPDPGLHGALDWLLRRRWNEGEALAPIDRELTRAGIRGVRGGTKGRMGWYVNEQSDTMTIVPGPIAFEMGSPACEPGREDRYENRHRRQIDRSYALACREVTVAQFRRFRPDFPTARKYSPDEDGPVIRVTWYEAAEYCNWLSRREGLPESEWCYLPNEQGRYAEGMSAAADHLHRTGYRLPTEAEWEFACRVGVPASRYYGSSEELLGKYAQHAVNAGYRTRPVGELKPNDLGLFDMLGNVQEWCQDEFGGPYPVGPGDHTVEDLEGSSKVRAEVSRVVRGGSFDLLASNVRCAARVRVQPAGRYDTVGFRVARTWKPPPDKDKKDLPR
jgi:formylglycine-generating enzyme required for sulfatase activity/tetratricopeptide (TPR) repeat protein